MMNQKLGNYGKPITQTRYFEISAGNLWKLISSPGNLNDCHPFCLRNDVLQWNDEGHKDCLIYLNGRTYIRNFQSWDEGNGYTLNIGEEGGKQSFVIWSIVEISENKSKLSITVYPYLLAKLPKIISFLPYTIWIRPRLEKYLESVLTGFEYVSVNNKPVPRNYFGRHPWFS